MTQIKSNTLKLIAASTLYSKKLNAAQSNSNFKESIYDWLYHRIVSGKWQPDIGHNIVLEKYKAVYLAIPKVANSSLKEFFAEDLGLEGNSERKGGRAYIFNHKESRKELIKSRVLISKAETISKQGYFKFAFVRNPWDRLLSFYNSAMKSDNVCNTLTRVYGDYFFKGMSLDAFIKSVVVIPDAVANRHFISQHIFLTDNQSRLIPDFIGKFETLDADFDKVCKKINLKNRRLKNVNLNRVSKNYREQFSSDAANLVAMKFKKDIELFNYEF